MFEKIKQLMTGNLSKGGRQVYIDDLRVIATVFVIGVHTVSLAATMTEYGSIPFRVLTIFNFIFLSCNLLFVMLSGALLLPVKNESIGNFFRKRFTKVAIPLVVYYILYIVAKEGLVWLRPDHWILMLRRILTGAPMEAPHFWLVYVIIWLYVLTPFMRYIVHNIPDTVLSGVIGVVFAICALDTYLPLYGINSVFGIVVDSYAGTFLLGYFLSEKCSRKVENFFMFSYIFTDSFAHQMQLQTVRIFIIHHAVVIFHSITFFLYIREQPFCHIRIKTLHVLIISALFALIIILKRQDRKSVV